MRLCALVFVATALWGQTPEEWTEKAAQSYRAGQYQQAIESCNRAIQLKPDLASAYYRRGLAYWQLRKYDAALADYNRKIQLEPGASNGFIARGNVLFNLKRYAESLADADRGIALDPANANLHVVRGLALRALKRLDEADGAFTKALGLNPKNTSALINLGLMKQGRGDARGAIELYTRVLAVDPQNNNALLNRSASHIALKDYDAAIADTDLLISRSPDDADAKTNRAKAEALKLAAAPVPAAIKPPAEPPRLPVLSFKTSDPCASAPAKGVPWEAASSAGPLPVDGALPSPLVDVTKIASSQYNGAVSVAMEGMRLLYGEMSEQDVRAFEAAWTPLFDHPTNKALDYMNRLTPLLGQFLSGREAWLRAAAGLEMAMLESALGVAANARDGWFAAMAEADRQASTMAALEGGLAQLAARIQQMGNPPNPVEAKCSARKKYRETVDRLADSQPQSELTGIWERWQECTGDFAQDPDVKGALERTGISWSGVGRTQILLVFPSAESLDPQGLAGLSPEVCPLTRLRLGQRDGEGTVSFAQSDASMPFQTRYGAYANAPMEIRGDQVIITPPSPRGCRWVARRIDSGLPDPPSGWQAEDLLRLRQDLPAELGRIGPTLKDPEVRGEIPGRQKTLQDVAACRTEYLQVRQIFFDLAGDYLRTTEAKDRKLDDHRQIAKAMETRLRSAPPPAATQAAAAPPKPEPSAVEALQETIAFHESMAELLKRNLAREQADLARETDPARKKEFAFRALQLESDLQAEQDLIASHKTGTLVHTRSSFDEYAHQQFVRKTVEEAARVDLTRKIAAGMERQIDLLPPEQRPAMRAQARRIVDARTVASGDVEKARQMAAALDKQVQGYWQGESARQEEKAIAAEQHEFYAQMVIMASGSVVAGLGQAALAETFGATAAITIWSPHLIGGIYGGTTGLISGGPAEGISQAIMGSSMVGATALQFLQGYRQVSAQPGAKVEDALWAGATQAGTGFVLGKVISIGGALATRGAQNFFGRESRLFQPLVAPRLNWQQQLDAARLQDAVKEAESQISRFQQLQTNLARSRAQLPAGSAELAALEKEARVLAASLNSSYHGKWQMKYKGHPSLQRAFSRLVEDSYSEMMPEMRRLLRTQGYDVDNIEFKAVRNASSSGTSSMDLDLALKERPGMVITRNGQQVSLQEFQRDAQRAMNTAYHGVTGYSAVRSELNLTTSVHEEAFRNLKLLKHNVDFTAISPDDVAQIGKVLAVKLDKIAGDPILTPLAKVQASCREASKEIGNMLLPNLRQRLAQAPAGSPQAQQLRADLAYWEDMGRRMRDIGTLENNPYRILELDREMRRETGGLSAVEVVRELTRFFDIAGARVN